MTHDAFLAELSEILEAPEGTVSTDTKLEDLEGWNSMAMISFIALADEHFGKTLSPRQFGACNTVGDLAGLVGL